MLRRTNNLNQQIILFIGEGEIITLGSNQQIGLASRTLLLKQNILLTYKNPVSSVDDPKLSAFSRSKNPPIPLDKLTNHQFQYKITATMLPKLLLGRKDEGVEKYFRQLRLSKPKQMNLVVIANQEDQCMNGFVFNRQNLALEFYQSLNIAIITQIYQQKLPQTIPFNYKIVGMLGQAANGRCLINPDDFAEGKNQQSQVGFVIDFLKGLQGWPLINMKGYLMQLQLQFKILDDSSKGYATRFLQCFPNKIEKLKIQNAQLTSNMVYQLFPAYGLSNFCEKLNHLQQLNLQKNQLTDDVFTTLAKIIYYCTKMHTLNLADNNITLQKQGSFEGFLTSITLLRLNLSLNKNRISSVKIIIKYLISAEGTLPLSQLDLSNNPISPEDTNILTKAYLNKIKQLQNENFKLFLNQLEFSEPHSFQFLQEQYKNKKPNSLSIPVTLSKHPLRKKGKEIGNTQQQINQSTKIDELFKSYAYELFRGNFNKLKGIKVQLRKFGVEQQIIEEQLKRYEPLKKQQERMISNKMQNCLNFELSPYVQLKQMNEAILFCKRKGLTGPGFDILCFLKDKIDQTIQLTLSQEKLGSLYRQIYYTTKGRYQHYYLQGILQQKQRLPYAKLLQMSKREIMKAFLECQNSEGFSNFILYQYLLMQKSLGYTPQIIEYSLINPQLSSLKIARFQRENIIEIPQKQRIKQQYWSLKKAKMAFISQFSIQTYNFSQAFIESGVSSSAYSGILSRGKVEPDQYKLIEAFIEISKNFLKFLYYTPDQLSDQAIMYLNYIVNHLGQLQNQIENQFKLILAEQFFIHFFTFYDSNTHKKLKQGLQVSICEFILRRVDLDDELANRVAAFLLKSMSDETTLRLHNQQGGQARWSRKVDWKVKDLPTLRHLILSRGKVQVKIADYTHPDLVISIEVDQIDTVSDLWREIKENVGKLNQFTNISKTNIDYYWICGKKNTFQPQCFIFLPNYEHIGKLIFEQDYQITFCLKRLIFTPQQHSIKYLSMIKYQDLIAIFEQAKHNIRLVSTLLLQPKTLQQQIISIIWIDVLLAQQLLLGQLRRQNDEQNIRKYKLQRQKIVNEMISKLYDVYIPNGFALDEKARTNIILQIKKKQQSAIPKNINQSIREQIMNFIETVGIAAYTVAIFNENNSSTLFANNHELIFVENSQNQKKVLKVKFRNILWFQLISNGKQISLRFQQLQKIQKQGVTLHKFNIGGDKQWIGSCLSLITQIARNRLSYPLSLLCANQDNSNSITNHHPQISKQASLLVFPILNVQKFFKFDLPRRVVQPTVLIVQPAPKNVPVEKINNPIQNQIQENQNNLVPQPRQIKKIQNPRQSINSTQNKNLQIEDVIQAAQNQEDEEVVSVRKSNNTNRKEPPRRRSRNR